MSLLGLLLSTKGTSIQRDCIQHPAQLPISTGVNRTRAIWGLYIGIQEITAPQLHATSTVADESNEAKVGIGGDDGHDERKDGG